MFLLVKLIQTSVKDVTLQASSSKIQVINLATCSVNVVSPWNQFAVDISQVHPHYQRW